jgi:plastocyanin
MTIKVKIVAIGSLAAIGALLLSACGVAHLPAISQPTVGPGYANGPGMTHAPARSAGVGGSGMMGGGPMGGGMTGSSGMMGGYGYGPSGPTAVPTPLGATPIPVSEEFQITAANAQFTPAQITVKPGETVRFVVTNRDPFLHNFVNQAAGIPFLNLPGNTAQTVTWTAPTTPGTYTAVCTLHPGMSLSILVQK